MPEKVHEQAFVADVASWINSILEKRNDLPFTRAKVEKKRCWRENAQNLTLYDCDGNKPLTGEVKMPDGPDRTHAIRRFRRSRRIPEKC